MSGVYERPLLLGSEHVDCFRRLRVSTLFELLQTASIRHTEELGVRRDKTLDRGLLWVVARQHVVVERMPAYDERIIVRSWPGETLRVLFPRYYELVSERGEDELFPWDVIDHGFLPGYMRQEYGRALRERAAAPCQPPRCRKCGVCHAREA